MVLSSIYVNFISSILVYAGEISKIKYVSFLVPNPIYVVYYA